MRSNSAELRALGDAPTGRELMCGGDVKILRASVRSGYPCWLEDQKLLDELSSAEKLAYQNYKEGQQEEVIQVVEHVRDYHEGDTGGGSDPDTSEVTLTEEQAQEYTHLKSFKKEVLARREAWARGAAGRRQAREKKRKQVAEREQQQKKQQRELEKGLDRLREREENLPFCLGEAQEQEGTYECLPHKIKRWIGLQE
jgi:hypothetical protein